MNRLYVVTDFDGNIAYSLDATNWTPISEKPNIVTSCEKFCWFPITLQVKKILHCIKRNKIEGAVKLKEYIQQHTKL